MLAQAVIAGKTIGYRKHPQLNRFLESADPNRQIAAYLREVHAEAARRSYRFDAAKINSGEGAQQLVVTCGQLEYEWMHLTDKIAVRAPAWLNGLGHVATPEPHPSFKVIEGEIADWEVFNAEIKVPRQ